MKIYRIVPDTFSTRVGKNALDSYNFLGFEDLYYKMGYTSLQTNELISSLIDNTGANSFRNSIGKYFFIYPEECLKYAIYLNKYLTLNYILLEYDFPIDILVDSIGYGHYNEKLTTEFCIDFKKISSKVSKIDEEKKKKIFIESLEYTKSQLQECDKYADLTIDAIEMYEQYIEAENQVFESQMYQTYMNKKDDIYQNPYLTGNYAFINFGELVCFLEGRCTLKDILLKKNMIVSDYSLNVDNNIEEELINNCNKDKKDEIRKILTIF